MLKIVVTERAQFSLEEIVDYYLAHYTEERTLKVLNSIEETFELIAVSPNIFPVCFDIENPSENIKQAIVHNTFKVVFRVSAKQIEIIEIFHGKRNPELLKDISK